MEFLDSFTYSNKGKDIIYRVDYLSEINASFIGYTMQLTGRSEEKSRRCDPEPEV